MTNVSNSGSNFSKCLYKTNRTLLIKDRFNAASRRMKNQPITLARAFFGVDSIIQHSGFVHLGGQKKLLGVGKICSVGSHKPSDPVLSRRPPGSHVRRAAGLRCSSTSTVANVSVKHQTAGPQKSREVSFPCIEQHEVRSANLLKSRSRLLSEKLNAKHGNNEKSMSSSQLLPAGPEPTYSKLVSGYQLYRHSTPFALDYGKSLPQFELAYETWGKLSAAKDNAILLHTGLSASSHAKSHDHNPSPGWWEKFVGNGQSYPIDLDRHFVICTNVLGSCYGSTGPSSNDPSTGGAYATHFPILSIFDMVRAQFKLLDHLGIDKLYASIGSSMGGMQSIAAAWLEPSRVGKVVSISGCGRSGPSSIALRYAQRSVLMADPNWNRGFYYDSLPPHTGMKLARQIATITYRSGPEWEQRFGRRRRVKDIEDGRSVIETPALCPDFLIETYLDHQGEQFCLKYDANSLLYVSKAMDLFDMSSEGLSELSTFRAGGSSPVDPRLEPEHSPRHVSSLPSYSANIVDSLAATFQKLPDSQKFLILGAQSDLLFPVSLQRELAEALRQSGKRSVTYYELDSPYGHDTFLIDLNGVGGAIRGFLS